MVSGQNLQCVLNHKENKKIHQIKIDTVFSGEPLNNDKHTHILSHTFWVLRVSLLKGVDMYTDNIFLNPKETTYVSDVKNQRPPLTVSLTFLQLLPC